MREFPRIICCSSLLLMIGCTPSLQKPPVTTSDIVNGMTKDSVRATSGLEETSGRIVHDGKEYEYTVYFRYPSKKYWSTDRSAWIVLYDSNGRVAAASDDWSTLPQAIVEPIRKEYREMKDEEIRQKYDSIGY